MIFVDTSVVMYAVGRAHPLREEAQEFFRHYRPPKAFFWRTACSISMARMIAPTKML